MTLLERDERMRAEGREEGREEGILGSIKILLEADMPVEEIKDKIITTYSISRDKAEEFLKAVNPDSRD